MTEDDTFRVLGRVSFKEMCRILNQSGASDLMWGSIANKNGWKLTEIHNELKRQLPGVDWQNLFDRIKDAGYFYD